MSFLLSLVLPVAVCVLLVGITSAFWWGKLQKPWAYVAFAFLAVLGLHRIVQVGAEFLRLFRRGGYYLEYQNQPDLAQLAERSLTIEALLVSTVLVVAGWPLLRWLRALLSR
ncbi:hypothetical protein [Variovorax boronicumulans]|uniref:hypothetical protein n=1 Tax=Variovorax boronicumulans TaxID=436515 RepID=UPI00278B7063|nr:hypothetical protein [Variovorax boronicumulans]MDQ0042458.1 membrane protein YdbS with pleckstrin-like domain [Variovorax boronicumulans]